MFVTSTCCETKRERILNGIKYFDIAISICGLKVVEANEGCWGGKCSLIDILLLPHLSFSSFALIFYSSLLSYYSLLQCLFAAIKPLLVSSEVTVILILLSYEQHPVSIYTSVSCFGFSLIPLS